MAEIVLEHVNKSYPDGHAAVQDLSITIADGEFLILVGPSGCGKTTTLNMIAGLEEISSGELRIGGERVNEKAPKDRDIAMVFQSYALYPHMTVRQNIAFPLTLAKMKKAEIAQKVEETAKTLDLTPLLDRKPSQLSGGQRQRVAMGRAIVRHPKAFLMDEPLSNLDAALRAQMRAELIRLHSSINATIVYVTHDQAEAMTMATRIAVMCKGHLRQVDTPQEIYDHPSDLFVACFVGLPKMNILPGRLSRDQGDPVVEVLGVQVKVDKRRLRGLHPGSHDEVVVGIRPEDVVPGFDGVASVAGQVELVEPLGSETLVTSRCGNGAALVARFPARSLVASGEPIRLGLNTRNLHLFDKVTEQSLLAKVPSATRVLRPEVIASSSHLG
jgi:multiple sugar transport system ATP-binding protein